MWKRTKNAGQSNTRSCFSLVHQYIQRFNEVSGNKTAAIRRRSKTPGVMITQYLPTLPEGKSTPDFQLKPAPVTVKEGKMAVFKAVVTGDPKPEVSWRRTKGTMSDKEKFQRKYDDSTWEYTLEIHKVTSLEADTYKCYAANDYGKAVCTTTLNVIEASTNPADFRKLLKKSKQEEDGENDEKFWDAMLNAERNDYERICSEYGVPDVNVVFKKLEEKKRERSQNKQKENLIPYDYKTENCANKVGGKTKDASIINQLHDGMDMHQTGIHENNCYNNQLMETRAELDLFTEFKLSNVDFVVKIQEMTVQEKDNALFECVLTHPLSKITWMRKGVALEDGEKYNITVSDHCLIHKLQIKACTKTDKGIYSAVAGITSCSAWLVVEDERKAASGGRRTLQKATPTGGKRDLEKVAKEQQIKNQKEIEKILEAVKAKYANGQQEHTSNGMYENTDEKRGETEKILEAVKAKYANGQQDNSLNGVYGHTDKKSEKSMSKISKNEENVLKVIQTDCVLEEKERRRACEPTSTKYSKAQMDWDAETDSYEEKIFNQNGNPAGAQTDSKYPKYSEELEKELNYEEIDSSDWDRVKHYQDQNQRQIETTGSGRNKKSTHSVGNQKITKKVQWKDDQFDPSEHESDSDVNEDAAGQTTSQEISKRSKKKKDALAKDSNENTCWDEQSEDEVRVDQTKDQRNAKKSKRSHSGSIDDLNEYISDEESIDQNKEEDSVGQMKHRGKTNRSKRPNETATTDKSKSCEDNCGCKETEESVLHPRRKRQGPLFEDSVIDLGVHFVCGLSDVNAIINEPAELTCQLSSDDGEGMWFRDGKKIFSDENFSIIKNGEIHTLLIKKCEEEHSGKYRFEVDGRKTEAMVNVKDPPRFNQEDRDAFVEPLTVKVGHNAIFKMQFVGHRPIKVQWYREGEELQNDNYMKIENSGSHSRLLLIRCQRKHTGEIKIKLKNEHGFAEAVSQLIVLDKPTPPLGPAEVTESSASCVEFKWRPPKDDGGLPIISYILERQQVGRNTWKKIGEVKEGPSYRDTDVDRGRKYCYRIRAVTLEGTSDAMETDEIQAGTFALPGPPTPPTVTGVFHNCINLTWTSPSNNGGSRILGYIVEKRKKGSNLWTVINIDELVKEKKLAVTDVMEGMEYEFRVAAVNLSGAGEFSNASEVVCARDPKKPPGKVTGLKVTEISYSSMVLTWTKPEEIPGEQDEAKGYFVEIRQADSIEWSRCNSSPIFLTSFNVKGLKAMDMYWVRVIATNDGGEGVPAELPNYVLAMPLPVRPKFTNKKMKSFMVVRAGNSVRITVNFEASPRPDIMWLKDNVPVMKRVTVSNSDGSSQLLIPSSERSDSGIYSILVKNLVGQETFSTEVRVTDDPKPPGPVELEENVPGTVTIIWEPSPDEKRDDRLHYTVSKLDSTKHTWTTVAERLFNNRFTICNIMQGREYHFRVYAKNDMGISEPSESPTWGVEKKKEKVVVCEPVTKDCDLQCAPSFIVPLKLHTATKGYECYMSCAVKGNPTPRVTWYRNNVSLNTDSNYYISNTFGVCSMRILNVGPKDVGEYTIIAENSLGRAECSTVLSVRD